MWEGNDFCFFFTSVVCQVIFAPIVAPWDINLPQPWTLALPMKSQRKSLLNEPFILSAFAPGKIKIRSKLEFRKRGCGYWGKSRGKRHGSLILSGGLDGAPMPLEDFEFCRFFSASVCIAAGWNVHFKKTWVAKAFYVLSLSLSLSLVLIKVIFGVTNSPDSWKKEVLLAQLSRPAELGSGFAKPVWKRLSLITVHISPQASPAQRSDWVIRRKRWPVAAHESPYLGCSSPDEGKRWCHHG